MAKTYRLVICFPTADERNKYLLQFNKAKERRLNNEWLHHLTRAYLYENPQESITYKEAFQMIKKIYL